MRSKALRVHEKSRSETMSREETVDQKNLCSRIPIRLRKRTTRL